MHTYAIGDIHGHIGLLRHQHALIAVDQAAHGAAPWCMWAIWLTAGPTAGV